MSTLPLAPLAERALVTGGAGYFGGILARHLADRGVAVVSYDRLTDPEPDARITYVQADLRDGAALSRAFTEHGPFGAVFHCAALMLHERPDPQDLWDSNVTGTRHLADLCVAHGVRKMVYTSTICVYGQSYDHLVGEGEPTCPVDDYGRSKLAAEELLAGYAGRLEVDSIRCPTIVSAGRLGLLAILFEFIQENRRVYLVGGGHNRYQFVYAPDLAEACLLASRAPGSHVYHVGSDDVKTLAEVYGAVIQEAGSSSKLVRIPEAPSIAALRFFHRLGVSPLGPYHSRLISGTFVFDTAAIKRDLGWRPTLTNDAMLREAYRHYFAAGADRAEDLPAHRMGAKMGVLRLVKWLS